MVKHFTDQLFETTSSEYSPIPPREPTPPKDTSKGKDVATEEPKNDLVTNMEEGGSNLKMPKMITFITQEGTLSQEDFTTQLREMKRLAELKEQEKKSEDELRRLLNLATVKAQTLKWQEHEAKKAKMVEEYMNADYLDERRVEEVAKMLSSMVGPKDPAMQAWVARGVEWHNTSVFNMTKPENSLKRADEEAERKNKADAERRAKLDEIAAKQRQREQDLEEQERLRRALSINLS
ncbi:hypothetical protein Tco_1165011 [Tanacetum coccineum]